MKKIINNIKLLIVDILGCNLMAFGIVFFLLPNKLSSGGFTGISTIFYYLFNIKVGTTTILLNIPLFIMTYLKLGKKFFSRAIFGTVALSLFLNIYEMLSKSLSTITTDKLLASIYGGLIIGVGSAIIMRNNSSTGGTELLSNIISKSFPQFKVSELIIVLDIIIVLANIIILKQIEIGLYSTIAIYIIGKMMEMIGEGTSFTKMIFIVSDEYEKIAKEISDELKRGSTAIYAKGMYKNKEKKILWCVASKNEITKIRQIASNIDQKSFMTIFNAREAYGLGFRNF